LQVNIANIDVIKSAIIFYKSAGKTSVDSSIGSAGSSDSTGSSALPIMEINIRSDKTKNLLYISSSF